MANLSNINGKFVVEQTTGYVGVGTTDPSYPIEVLNASAEIALNASGGSTYRIQSDSASNFIIRKEGVGDRLVINSAGNSTFAGSITGTSANFSGGVNADYFRTLSSNSNYNLFTRNNTGNTIFVQAAQSNASQPIAKFSYGSATVNAGTAVLQVSKDNSHFVNCNVGIGYTSPGSQLSIYKTAFGGDTAGSGGTLDFGVGSTKYWQFRLDSSSSGDLAIDKTYSNVWTTPITIQRSSGNVGIGTASPANKLDVKISTSNRTTLEPVMSVSAQGNGPYTGFGPKISFSSNIYYGAATGNPAGIIETAYVGAVMGVTYATNSDLVFATRDGATSVTEKMRILGNGNVGIGTSSPDTLLELSKSVSNAQGATLRLTNAIGGGGAGVAVEFVGPGTQPIHAKIITEDVGAFYSNLIFQTKATGTGGALANRLIINTSTTDIYSNTSSGSPTLRLSNTDTSLGASQQIGSLEYYQVDPSGTGVGAVARINCVNESSFQGEAGLSFQTGSVSSITERMRIDSSGNVGIAGSPNNFTNQKSLTINGISGGNSRLDFQINGTNEAEIVANNASLIIAHNDILRLYTAATERMRIDSSGNVDLTSGGLLKGMSAIELKNNGSSDASATSPRLYSPASGTLAFSCAGAERMRLKSDGVLDLFGSIQSTGNQRFGVGPAHGNSSSPGITTKANTTNGIYWSGTSGIGGWGGGNFTTNNSDRNMKTNIVPMDIDALQIIDSLETKYFNWTEKANKGDTSIRKAGIIAQDLRELMPEGVYGTEWDDDDENTNGLSLDENATTALLIKAIQELKADNDSLKARIETLENN